MPTIWALGREGVETSSFKHHETYSVRVSDQGRRPPECRAMLLQFPTSFFRSFSASLPPLARGQDLPVDPVLSVASVQQKLMKRIGAPVGE